MGAGLETDRTSRSSGKERDTETGLDYFGARYYGSNVGRFTSVDPVWVKLDRMTDPQRLNLYTYVRNSPLIFTDPSGMELQIGRCGGLTPAGCADMLKRGLQKNDRGSVSLVKGDGKNGCSKGAYCIGVDANHKSDSGNFQHLQMIANSGDVAVIDSKGARDTVSSFAFTAIPMKAITKYYAGYSYEPTMNADTGYMGLSLYPIRGPLDSTDLLMPKSPDTLTHIVLATGPGSGVSADEMLATLYEEVAHVFLSDFGRTHKGDHGDPKVEETINSARKEASDNSRQ